MNRKASSTRRDYWQKLIGEQGGSGQSVSVFCRGRGVSEPSFYSWRRRLGEESVPLKFALVERGPAANTGSGLELALATGERLRITAGADAATLRMVLAVLRERR
jgi:hypothetical protein